MRARYFLALALALIVYPAAAQAPPSLPPGAQATETRLMTNKVGPQTRAWIRQEAQRERLSSNLSDATAVQAVRSNPALGSLPEGDVEALAFLVMMEASRSAQEDLKTIMDGVKQINSTKEALRQTNAKSKAVTAALRNTGPTIAPQARVAPNVARTAIQPVPVPKAEFDAKIAVAKNNLDSLNDMGEMESLRLQMAMDRMSKSMSTLSNMLKKISDASSTITQNLK